MNIEKQRLASELTNEVLDSKSSEARVQLESLIAESEEIRLQVARDFVQETLVAEEFKRTHATDLFAQIQNPISTRNRFRIIAPLATIAALLAIIAFMVIQDHNERFTREVSHSAKESESMASVATAIHAYPKDECAVLTQSFNVKWGIEQPPKLGDTLTQRRLKFAKGIIQLDFCSGANVVIEGPADFQIVSSLKAICDQGKVRVHAPPQASGFVISVPGMDVVDLGTEFAVSVRNDGKSEVHVLEGEVSLQPANTVGNDHKRLNKGRSIRFDEREGISEIVDDGATKQDAGKDFVNGERLAILSSQEQEQRFRAWQSRSSDLVDDPDSLVFYDFSQRTPWSRVVYNQSKHFGEAANGAIVGCRWQQGRWPGETALELKGVSDRVRLNIPGEYQSVSFAAWVNISGFNRERNALVLSDGWDVGEVHWQIGELGQLIIGVSNSFNEQRGVFEGKDYSSPPILDRSDLGRWVLLTSVCDGEANEIRHYVDGQRISTHPLEFQHPIRLGEVEIGNWRSLGQTVFLTRAFNGRIDELCILSRVLGDEEIAQTYANGHPGPDSVDR